MSAALSEIGVNIIIIITCLDGQCVVNDGVDPVTVGVTLLVTNAEEVMIEEVVCSSVEFK